MNFKVKIMKCEYMRKGDEGITHLFIISLV